MALDIDDGYTLKRSTEPEWVDRANGQVWTDLPVVNFRFRPALNEELHEMSYNQGVARSGKERLMASATLVASLLVSWDVLKKKKPSPITPEAVAVIPPPVYLQILDICLKWAPREQEDDAKKSAPGSASHSNIPSGIEPVGTA